MDMVERMVYVGSSKPWWMANSATMNSADGRGIHGGQGPITSKEMMELSGLGKFRVEKREAGFYSKSREQWYPVEGERFLVRTDTGLALGRCTHNYQEFQPSEGFEHLDRLAREGELLYHTAGILDGGRKVWLLSQTPSHYTITRRSGNREEHIQFLMSSLDYTGKGANVDCPTSVRVVCANTERMAREGAPVIFRVTHRGDMDAKYAAVRASLNEMYAMADEKRYEDQLLANALMRRSEMVEVAVGAFLDLDLKEEIDAWFAKASDRSKSILKTKVEDVTRLFDRGIQAEGDSAYDALQAFTQYFDHDHAKDARSKVDQNLRAAKALASSFDGQGADMKSKVRQRLLRKIGA